MTNDDGLPVFQHLLGDLLDANNEVREQAEKKYEGIPSVARVRLLLAVACNDQVSLEVRKMSLVLFRRLISSDFDNISKTMPPESFDQIKNNLLLLIKHPCDSNLKKKICDTASELARNLIDDDGNNLWPDFLNSLFESVNSSDRVIKECALNMFSYVPGIFGNQQNKYLEVIRQMLVHCLSDTTVEVRTAGMKAAASFILAHADEKSVIKPMQDLVPHMIQLISNTVLTEGENCDQALHSLVEMVEKSPLLFRNQFDPVMQLSLSITGNAQVSESRRHLALEIIISMAEAAPATVRKRGSQYLSQIVQSLLLMMTDIEEDEDWATADTLEGDDYESEAVIGETSLDRLACAVGGKTVLPIVITTVSDMLKNQNYKYRVAGLMALSAVGEGCHAQMLPLLPEVVEGIIPYLKDAHFRVRYAACNALGQMATDFGPDFQTKFHSKVIPGLLEELNDYANPRVQAHAGAALVNFFEDFSVRLVSVYLDAIAAKLHELLAAKMQELSEKGKKLVLEQTVVTLAALADAAQENFTKYYDLFIPRLKLIIANALQDNLKVLRGKAIEAISLIGLAVGRDKFCSDATDTMNLLLRQQTGDTQLADDDPQLSYMISAWARICKILGPEFEPYLEFVMGPVLKAASIKIEVAILDKDDVDTVAQDNDWQCVSIGEQQTFGIKTAGLEEKATACQMLVCYARELKQGFSKYVEETLKIMVPLLKFYFHDDIRVAAAESLPFLLEAAKVRGDAYMMQVWNNLYPELLKALECEPERDVLAEMFSSLAECIEKVGKEFMYPAQQEALIEVLDGQLKQHFDRAQKRLEKRKDEDYDEGVEEILEDEGDEDVYILSKVSDILHTCFLVFGEAFIPYFDKIVNHFNRLGAPDRTWSEHQWAICVFDDVIENTGPASLRYRLLFMPLITGGLESEHAEVRQAAAYGWGVLAQFAGEDIGQNCADILPLLCAAIEAGNSRSAENINATENAISAMAKILHYNSSKINVNKVLPVWISYLPVYEDEEELPHVYGFLIALLENNHPVVLGENNCNIPRIVSIFAEVLARNAIDVDSLVGAKIVSFLKSLQQNANLFGSCVSGLNPAQQLALKEVLGG